MLNKTTVFNVLCKLGLHKYRIRYWQRDRQGPTYKTLICVRCRKIKTAR